MDLFVVFSVLFLTLYYAPYMRDRYLLHQDEYVEKLILDSLNEEFPGINFNNIILYDVINLDKDGLIRYSWYYENSSSRYLRVFRAADGVMDPESNPNYDGLNVVNGFIDLNRNIVHQDLNHW